MKECNRTITIYNSYTDPITKYKKYLPTVISGVSWFGDVRVAVVSEGLKSADLFTIRIPIDADFGGKEYKTPKEFIKIPNDEMVNYWTMAQGDTIVLGDVATTDPNAKPSELEAKYDDVITIVSVTDSTKRPNAPHWRVVGK